MKYMIVCERSAYTRDGKILTFDDSDNARGFAQYLEGEHPDALCHNVDVYDEKREPAYIQEQENLKLAIEGGPHLLTVADIRNILMGLSSDISRLRQHIAAHGVDTEETDSNFTGIFEALKELGQHDNM